MAIQLSAASGIPTLLTGGPKYALSTILFHKFFFEGESKEAGRERLKRQLDWLTGEYTIIRMSHAEQSLTSGGLPEYPLLITVDDAKTDLLDVWDVFDSFGAPLSIFVCVGWTSEASSFEEETALAHVVSALQWYDGPETTLHLRGGSALEVRRDQTAGTIGQLLKDPNLSSSCLYDIISQLDGIKSRRERTIGTWDEMKSLHREGIEFGCHSVSHISLAQTDELRLEFEVREAKRLLELKFGGCSAFAYPFGIPGSFNKRTRNALVEAGLRIGFITDPGFGGPHNDPLQLPRFAMPDRNMSISEFRARVRGGGVVTRRLSELIGGIATGGRIGFRSRTG